MGATPLNVLGKEPESEKACQGIHRDKFNLPYGFLRPSLKLNGKINHQNPVLTMGGEYPLSKAGGPKVHVTFFVGT